MAQVDDDILKRVKDNTAKLATLEELARGNNENLNALMAHVMGQGEKKGLYFRVAELEDYRKTIDDNLKFIKRGVLGALIVLIVNFGWSQYSRATDVENLRQQLSRYEQQGKLQSEEQKIDLIDRRLDERLKKILDERK